MNSIADERRDFFRIDDSLRISCQAIEKGAYPERLERWQGGEERQFTIMSSLSSISQEMIGFMHRIEAKDPDVANYLKALDKKTDLLGQALLAQVANFSEQSLRTANLSGSGLSFANTEIVEPGTMLELKFLLMPDCRGLMVLAEVIGCSPMENPPDGFDYVVRVKFAHIQESDRDLLIQHVTHRQSEDLKRRREEREEND